MIESYIDNSFGVWDSLRVSKVVLFLEMFKFVGSGGCWSFHRSLPCMSYHYTGKLMLRSNYCSSGSSKVDWEMPMDSTDHKWCSFYSSCLLLVIIHIRTKNHFQSCLLLIVLENECTCDLLPPAVHREMPQCLWSVRIYKMWNLNMRQSKMEDQPQGSCLNCTSDALKWGSSWIHRLFSLV